MPAGARRASPSTGPTTAPIGLAVAAVVVLALIGCSGAPTTAGLVGVWHDDAGVAVLTLQQGGRCSAHDLLSDATVVSSSGCTWTLGGGERHVVELDFRDDPKAALPAATYSVDGGGSSAVLFQVTDADTDARYVLSR